MIVLVTICSYASAWLFFAEGTQLCTTLNNVTYIVPSGGLNCTSIIHGDYCVNITGGTFANDYCSNATEPTNVTLGSAQVDIYIYDEQTQKLIMDRNIFISLHDEQSSYASNYTTTTGTLNLYNQTASKYQITYNAYGYQTRAYYVSLSTNTNQRIDLYLLNNSDTVSQRVILSVYDQDSMLASNITISLLKNFIYGTTSQFKTVSMSKSNFEGQAILYVEMYDVWYQLLFQDNTGKVVKITSPSPFMTTTPEESINLLADTYESWRAIDSIIGNVSFLNSTGTIYARFIFIDTSGLTKTGCLNVQRMAADGIYNLCNNCTNASTATLTCVINHKLPGEFKAVGLIDTNTTNSWYALDTNFYKVFNIATYGQEGVFFSAITIGTLTLIGIGSVVGSLWLLILGLIGMVVSGFITGFNLSYIYWVGMLAMIIIFMIKRD